MNHRQIFWWVLVWTILLSGTAVYAETFHAYYTKIDSGQAFERTSRTGPYADIVVQLDKGRFVFWRGSSYLPYWETDQGKWFVEEVIDRQGDGPVQRPDKVNTYSHVDIVEALDSHVTVLWRYLPEFGGTNPHTGVRPDKFVEELFTVRPDGSVTRVIRRGTRRVADWVDPLNRTTQRLALTATGISPQGSTVPALSPKAGRVTGSPLQQGFGIESARTWRFDEGIGSVTVESATGTECRISGQASFWKQGVSGTALQFDGYHTEVSLDPAQAPRIGHVLTLSGWVAIGAYPWNWTPIIQQGDDTGYFLGISGHGEPGLKVQIGDRWEELTSDRHLERNRWYHIVGVVDGGQGVMAIYIDGQASGTQRIRPGQIRTVEAPIQIGKGKACVLVAADVGVSHLPIRTHKPVYTLPRGPGLHGKARTHATGRDQDHALICAEPQLLTQAFGLRPANGRDRTDCNPPVEKRHGHGGRGTQKNTRAAVRLLHLLQDTGCLRSLQKIVPVDIGPVQRAHGHSGNARAVGRRQRQVRYIGKHQSRGQPPQALRFPLEMPVPVSVQLAVCGCTRLEVDGKCGTHDQPEIRGFFNQLELALDAPAQKRRGQAGQQCEAQLRMSLPQHIQHGRNLCGMTEAMRCNRREQVHRSLNPYTRPAACWSAW